MKGKSVKYMIWYSEMALEWCLLFLDEKGIDKHICYSMAKLMYYLDMRDLNDH